jgi:hypothetical protein
MANKKAKEFAQTTAKVTMEVTSHILKIIFILLVAYIGIVTLYGYLNSGEEYLNTIATLSVGGFWAFFFGYFGWRLGQSLEDYLVKRKIFKMKKQ